MPITKQSKQVLWAGATSASVAAGAATNSDALAIGQDAIGAIVQIKAVHSGTPAGGDTVDIFALYTAGDPDADPDVADEYDTALHGEHIARLDLASDSPAITTAALDHLAKGVTLRAVNNGAAAVTIYAQVHEQNFA